MTILKNDWLLRLMDKIQKITFSTAAGFLKDPAEGYLTA